VSKTIATPAAMPSASTSHPTPAAMPSAMPASPKASAGPARPGLLKRHSSHSASVQGKQAARDTLSPGSQPETQQALRHTARNNKHARIILPRNHSSGRNLPKMARQQAVVAQDSAQRQHGRNRSHENDTEIRLPGSLDESSPAQQQVQREQQRPAMRRNMTSVHLSRNASHTKLKKNLSHGQLQRLNSRGNLAAMGQSSVRAPPSPGLKGKNKRPKSADTGKWALEKDLHEQEVELALRIAEKKARGPKKVGFAVGSSGDSTGEEAIEDMEDAGMEEGEWTEESTSASPYSTRQNTANNSRRTSSAQERTTDRALMMAATTKIANEAPHLIKVEAAEQGPRSAVQEEENADKVAGEEGDDEDTATEEDDHIDDPPKSRSQFLEPKTNQGPSLPVTQPRQEPPQQHVQPPQQNVQPPQPQPQDNQQAQQPQKVSQVPRSPLHGAKEHPNPTIPLLRNISSNHPPPAMTSNVNAMDNSHSTDGSPATSTLSARSTLAGDGDQDELVSRFIPSTSHPGSNPVTTQNTPKSAQFHTPPAGDSIRNSGHSHHHSHSNQAGDAVSPGNSTKSGSSGTATPSIGRSRIELKMLQEKAMAEIHSVVDRNPFIPAHVYDRRNESLKSYLNLAALNNVNTPIPVATTTNTLANSSNLSLGPEIFQGRFKAVHTELRVVQKFRDPLAESVARLRACKGSKLSLRTSPQKLHAAALRTSKSAISLPASAAAAGKGKAGGGLHSRAVSGAAAEKALSGSPVKGGPVGGGLGAQLQGSKSSVNVQQQGQQQQMQMQQGRRMQGQRGVSFAGANAGSGGGQNGEDDGSEEAGAVGPEVLARKLWAEIGTGSGNM
jgi:hypothetical protein